MRRLLPDGSIDQSFADIRPRGQVNVVAQHPHGGAIVGGDFTHVNELTPPKLKLAVFTQQGSSTSLVTIERSFLAIPFEMMVLLTATPEICVLEESNELSTWLDVASETLGPGEWIFQSQTAGLRKFYRARCETQLDDLIR